ncbi:MAG TPA: MarR family winged helix-turn-helix transcriptional regulator [Kribbella sp.]|nr:MarR family winged helix-turn-helix transcriptional regulator [Kribbella sp.]
MTNSPDRPLDAREDHLWQSYLHLYRELIGVLEARLAGASGLSGAEYVILEPLSKAQNGALRTKELRQLVGWEKSRVSHQVSRMARNGLVVREDYEGDGRGSMVRLTDVGRTTIEAARPSYLEAVRGYLLARLSRDEQDTLAALLDRVRNGLPASGLN